MKKRLHSFLCLVLSLLFLFGCAPQEEKPSGSTVTTPSSGADTNPSASADTNPSEASNPTAPSAPTESVPVVDPSEIPAAPVTFDLDTAARSSNGKLWETEAGYFYYDMSGGHLVYADKSDLRNWVIVCNKPNCQHDRDTCPAYARGSGGFYLKDGRIYTVVSTTQRTSGSSAAFAVYSVPMDGSDDIRLEYPLENIRKDMGQVVRFVWRPDGIYMRYMSLDKSGMYENTLSRVDAQGEHIFYARQTEDQLSTTSTFTCIGNGMGDLVVMSSIPEGIEDAAGRGKPYWVTEGGFEEIPNMDKYLSTSWTGHFRGDNVYRFVPNDGYYYTDLRADQSVKWMDAQLEDSRAYIYGTDFIVETNLFEAGRSQMRIYNGTEWKDVALPENIWTESTGGHVCQAITTTHYIFSVAQRGTGKDSLYMVDLTQDELKAVRCAEFSAKT